MATNNTVLDYLKWRGDLTFAADPFNNVDNLILSQLAYVDFDGIVSEKQDEKIGIVEVCEKYWQKHTEEEIMGRVSFVKMSPFLLRPLAASKRFGGMKLSGFVNHVSKDTEAQMAVIQFELDDGTVYVAFRGTDETLIGWKEDFNLSFMNRTEGQRLAIEYLNQNFGSTSLRLRVGGHSKGGNFAVYASAFAEPEVRAQIEKVYTNDGPGFRREITESENYKEVIKKTVSLIPQDSVIGRIFRSKVEPIVVESSARGIMQHDALTWQVEGKRFLRTKRSNDSVLFEKVFDDWLNNVDDSSRRQFVDQIFNILMAAGADTMKQFRNSNFTEMGEVMAVVRKMPKEQQKEIINVITQLLRSGEKNFYEQISISEDLPGFLRSWAARRENALKSLERKKREEADWEDAPEEEETFREQEAAQKLEAEAPADKSGESVSYG